MTTSSPQLVGASVSFLPQRTPRGVISQKSTNHISTRSDQVASPLLFCVLCLTLRRQEAPCHTPSIADSRPFLQHLVSGLSIPSWQHARSVTHPVPCAPQSLQNHCRFLACRSSGRFEIVLDASCSSRDLDCMLTNRVNTYGPAHACIRKRKTGSNIGELARLRRLMREEVLVDRCIVFSTVSSLALKEPTPM